MEQTYWNGEPCKATIVRVIVGPALKPTYWYAGLQGKEREAVRIEYADCEPFYIDNEDGSGWLKVTVGFGTPMYGHGSLAVEREVP
jgi:hypothetical protein